MDASPAFGPTDERTWHQDITLSWDQERWPTRRGWAVALALTCLIPALAFMPLGVIFFGPPTLMGVWFALRRRGPLVTPPGKASLRLAPDRLVYDVVGKGVSVTHFEMARDTAGEFELRLMDKANTAITISSRDGRTLELGERRLDPRIGGRHLLLSTWLSSWWPDVTSWHERLGPRGLALLDANRSSDSPQAIALRKFVRRFVRLAAATGLVMLAWILLLEPNTSPNGPAFDFPLGVGRLDANVIAGILAMVAAMIILLWSDFAARRERYVPGPHARFFARSSSPTAPRARPSSEDPDES